VGWQAIDHELAEAIASQLEELAKLREDVVVQLDEISKLKLEAALRQAQDPKTTRAEWLAGLL